METGDLKKKKFVELKAKMHLFMAESNGEHNKASKHNEAKGVNINVFATVNHNEYNRHF